MQLRQGLMPPVHPGHFFCTVLLQYLITAPVLQEQALKSCTLPSFAFPAQLHVPCCTTLLVTCLVTAHALPTLAVLCCTTFH